MKPASENDLSEVAELAGMHNTIRATRDSKGRVDVFCFQKSSNSTGFVTGGS